MFKNSSLFSKRKYCIVFQDYFCTKKHFNLRSRLTINSKNIDANWREVPTRCSADLRRLNHQTHPHLVLTRCVRCVSWFERVKPTNSVESRWIPPRTHLIALYMLVFIYIIYSVIYRWRQACRYYDLWSHLDYVEQRNYYVFARQMWLNNDIKCIFMYRLYRQALPVQLESSKSIIILTFTGFELPVSKNSGHQFHTCPKASGRV